MKNTVFLIISGMAILLSGCTGSSYGLFETVVTGSAMVNPNTPALLKVGNANKVCLSISPRSSLNIDVQCIFNYVQGDASVNLLDKQEDILNPWVQWHFAY